MTLEERNQIVEQNLNLVHFIIRKYFSVCELDYDDYFQEGCCYLMKAAECWDCTRGVKFSAYAAKSIFNGLLKYRQYYTIAAHGVHVPRTPVKSISSDFLKTLGIEFLEIDAELESGESIGNCLLQDPINQYELLESQDCTDWLLHELQSNLAGQQRALNILQLLYDTSRMGEFHSLRVMAKQLQMNHETLRKQILAIRKLAEKLLKKEFGDYAV